METVWPYLAGFAALLLGVAVILGTLYIMRIRRTIRRVGSFQCQYRPDQQSGWTTGIAVYGANRLDWYRLVSLSLKPQRSWPRATMTLGHPIRGARESDFVAVTMQAGPYRAQLAMSGADHNGLVSWIEATPPVPFDAVAE